MEAKFRSHCTITSALDVLGDKWVLVIVKQMLIEGMETFKDFLEGEEAIATNILSKKLKALEELGLISKSKLPNNKKTNIYQLTDKGLSLTPIVVEMALWADENLREFHLTMGNSEDLEMIRRDKGAYGRRLVEAYKEKRQFKGMNPIGF